MKVPMKWLGEFVETGLAPRELAHRLTMAGLEAEKVEEIGELWEKVYVGHVHSVARHPNADRLVLADISAGEHRLTVVTGAPNIAEGQKVALALAGARLFDGHSDSPTPEIKTLKPGTIRGVKSEGMACSEKELGISDEHEGILVLPDDAPAGTPLKDYLGDTVIEFEITPNLAHAFSVLGIAREAAAITKTPLRDPAISRLSQFPAAEGALVSVEAVDLCARYVAIAIDNVTVGPSPEWLTRRLTAAGLRPINNVVDATNYVMHEIGQPLHAFDRATLDESRIVVRRARPGERLETLDHVERSLTSDMLIIADGSKPVGIAGVIGGLNSEVSPATTSILLESANFDMLSVRQTARALKLRTDASGRFERGLDPNLASEGAARAADLIVRLCPGAEVRSVADIYPAPVLPRQLSMPLDRIRRLLGTDFGETEIFDALGRLEFEPEIESQQGTRVLTVRVPTYRRDVTIPEDIVEEVARVIGYEALPSTLPSGRSSPVKRDPMFMLRRSVRDVLVGAGISEAITYVTVSKHELEPFALSESGRWGFLHTARHDKLLRIKNPLQSGRNILRPTLVPSLLEAAAENLKHQHSVRLFELARSYVPRSPDELPDEPELAAVALAGRRTPLGLGSPDSALDFFDIKGVVDELFSRLDLSPRIAVDISPGLHPGRSAVYHLGESTIARIGEVHPNVARHFGIEDVRVAVAEIDLSLALSLRDTGRREVLVPRFMPVEQDFAVVVEESVAAASVQAALLAGAGPLATGITLFDIYRGPQVGEGKKSLAYRVSFSARDRTLTDKELVKVRGRIENALKQRVDGVLRS